MTSLICIVTLHRIRFYLEFCLQFRQHVDHKNVVVPEALRRSSAGQTLKDCIGKLNWRLRESNDFYKIVIVISIKKKKLCFKSGKFFKV
jgi:hypothetical protein